MRPKRMLRALRPPRVLVAATLAAMAGGLLLRLLAPPMILGTVALGTIPWQVVVDHRTGRAFVFTADRSTNVVSVLDTATGTLLRTVSVGGTLLFDSDELHFGAAPVAGIDERTQRVFISGQSLNGHGQVTVLDGRSGAILGTISLSPRLGQVGAVGVDEETQRVFITGQGLDGRGRVSVLDARGGALLRTLSLNLDPASIAVDAPAGRVFVTGSGGNVAMLDARTGGLLRTITVPATGGAITVDSRTARVFVGDRSSGTISMLDAHSGQRLRAVVLTLGVGVLAADEPANRVVVADPTRANVTMLDARSGTIVGTATVGEHPVAVSADQRTGRILVSALGPTNGAGHVTTYGSVSVLDGHTLAVRQTLRVGVAPGDLVVDEGSGHTIVVNSNYNPVDCSLATVPVAEGEWVQGLRWLAQRLPWLPIQLPQPPAPPTHGSATLLASARI